MYRRLFGAFCTTLLITYSSLSQASSKPKVVFIKPGSHDFWTLTVDFMKAAAEDLNIDLDIILSNTNRYAVYKSTKEAINAEDKPNYLIKIFQSGNHTYELLKAAEAKGIKTFAINTDTPPELLGSVGRPREKFKHWIGHIVPNDRQAGHELAERLVSEARRLGLNGKDDKYHIVALSGSRDSSAAHYRNDGLRRYIKQHKDVVLHQVVHAFWDNRLASSMTKQLLSRYPDTRIVWAANDGMALGAKMAIEESGKQPGEDVITGGIDWYKDAIDAVRSTELHTTLGGHFMDGAWALIQIYDYHQGIDFDKDPGAFSQSTFHAVTRKNVVSYQDKFGDRDWTRIDFRKFSKAYTPSLKKYDFSLKNVFRHLAPKPD